MDYLYLFKNFKLKEKKGISAVIATVVLVALTVGLVAVVATFVSNTVKDQTSKGTTCIDVIGKIEINSDYTCYNSSSNEFQFSINIKDAEIDSLIIAVENSLLETNTFEISSQEKIFENIKYYPGGSYEYNQKIKIPGKNSGKTYLLNMNNFGENLEGIDIEEENEPNSQETEENNNVAPPPEYIMPPSRDYNPPRFDWGGMSAEFSENKNIELLSNNGAEIPKSIKIAPIINNEQCDISDSLNNIVNCDLLI